MRFARQLLIPSGLCAISMAGGLAMAIGTRASGTDIIAAYFQVAWIASTLAVLLWTGLPWLRSPDHRHLSPSKAVPAVLRERWVLLILPLALLPAFMAGFTVMKICVPILVGFHWDYFWTQADALLFAGDPWRATHALIGQRGTAALALIYTLIWGVMAGCVLPIYLLSGSPERAINAYSAFMLTWLIGGVVGTAMFSSVGPVFADMVDPELGERFAPLQAQIAQLRGTDAEVILTTQNYLRQESDMRELYHGGGISAMPSMHVATTAFFVFLAGKSWWRWPALAMLLATWVGSIHFGYHYALDGIVGAAIAWWCWRICCPKPRLQSELLQLQPQRS